MIYHCGASLSKQNTDLLICHCTKQDLSRTSRHHKSQQPGQLLKTAMYRAAGSNRRMVRPSSMLAVKLLNNSCGKHAANFGPSFVYQAGGTLEFLPPPPPPPEILKLSMVIVLSQVLNSNLVPNCIRSKLRGSKFKILGGGGGGGGHSPRPHK